MNTTLEDCLNNHDFRIIALYLDQISKKARIVLRYPNGQFGIFEMFTKNGLPKLDTNPSIIYHNAPLKMAVKPMGYLYKDHNEIHSEYLGALRSGLIQVLEKVNLLGSCHLDPSPYIFNAIGYYRPTRRFGIDHRWFVSFCDGKSFANAKFRVFNPHPRSWTPWEVDKLYTVLNFDEISQPTMLSEGSSLFREECNRDGYMEIQKPYGRIPLYVAEALANWKPSYVEIEIPQRLDFFSPTFIPGMRYISVPLACVEKDGSGNTNHCVGLLDDNQTFHRVNLYWLCH